MPRRKTLIALIFAVLLLATINQPLAAAPRIAPIASGPYLLGGAENGKWIDAGATAKKLRGGERYRLYTTAGQIGATTGTTLPAEVICPDTWVMKWKPEPRPAEYVAFGGAHNPLPRKLRLHSPNTAVYRKAVADLLRAQGIANPDVRITKIVRVDLEGDGVDEVVLSATRMSFGIPSVAAGDYSLVVLRKIINGKVQTIPLAENYFPQAKEFIAPHTFSVPAVADFNGDGKLEIMVDWDYYEGSGAELYTVQGNKVSMVLESGCGV